MFLTNVLFNRRESPCVLRSQSGQSGRVAKPGVKTSSAVREKVYLATLMTSNDLPCLSSRTFGHDEIRYRS
jgi:hypothetical protein